MVRCPSSVPLSIAAGLATLLCIAPPMTIRAESAVRSNATFRSSLYRYAHPHGCHEPELSRPIPEAEDDGIADDDAALHLSVAATPLAVVDLPMVLCDARDSSPAPDTDTGAPRAPPRRLST